MIEFEIPGSGSFRIAHLVLDYNGTLACDGRLIDGVRDRLALISKHAALHVLTADTFGSVEKELQQIACKLFVIPRQDQAGAKGDYVEKLGCGVCAAVGNGRNDLLMLRKAALGIALVQTEGAFPGSVLAADVVCTHINDALDLFLNPLRLAATLRT